MSGGFYTSFVCFRGLPQMQYKIIGYSVEKPTMVIVDQPFYRAREISMDIL